MRISRSLVMATVFGLFVGPAQVAHGTTLAVDDAADASDYSTADGAGDTEDSVGDVTTIRYVPKRRS